MGDTYYHNAEKIKEALEKIDELIKFYVEHKVAMKEGRADESIRDLEGIRKILEYVDRSDDGWIPGVVGERTDKEGNKY